MNALEAALDANTACEAVFYAPGALASGATRQLLERASAAGLRLHRLAPGVMERIADTVTPQAICAVAGFVDRPIEALMARSPLFVCVEVRDPGNLGAILRSVSAAGAGGVIACAQSADPYNAKVVRASAGALFHVPLCVATDPLEVLEALHGHGYSCLATSAGRGEDYALAPLAGRVAFLLGNEARGLPPAVVAACDAILRIPIGPDVESLNVAMAATLLAFEVPRRARLRSASPALDQAACTRGDEAGGPQALA